MPDLIYFTLERAGVTGYIIDYKKKTVQMSRDNFAKLIKYFKKVGKNPMSGRIIKEYGYIFYT